MPFFGWNTGWSEEVCYGLMGLWRAYLPVTTYNLQPKCRPQCHSPMTQCGLKALSPTAFSHI